MMFSLIIKEITHRWLHAILIALAVILAVALFVIFSMTSRAANRETIRLMRDMGFNLRVIPQAADLSQLYLQGFSEATMPESYLGILATQEGFSYNHLVGTLQQRIKWRGHDVILTGLAPEVCPPGRGKSPMSPTIEPGAIYVGHTLAQLQGLQPDDMIEIQDRSFRVAHVLAESGNLDDIRLIGDLSDIQGILDMPGQINEIKAINCLCHAGDHDPLTLLRRQIGSVLPEAQVVQLRQLAQTRQRQRSMTQRYFGLLTPMLILVCGGFIAVLTAVNVRDRQSEIGILRALGYRSGHLAGLFLGKAVVIGLVGGAIGFFLGAAISLHCGPPIFKFTAQAMKPTYDLLGWVLLLAPAFAALASFVPAMVAASEDPARILRPE